MHKTIPLLPFKQDVETKAILKKVAKAHQALAELKGIAKSIPNEAILINTLSLQEAKDSSAIENIITTHDELYQSNALTQQFASIGAKEVFNYSKALQYGFQIVKETGILTNGYILQIQSEIEGNTAGFRKLPGTSLKNNQTGEVIYMPPQHPDEIVRLMDNLEHFINDDELSDLDPLVKMAIIHHQFESIHPFYDGNGRTGRIINILYLVKQDLLNLPILYLSRYINLNKRKYYQLLQEVRNDGNWESWIMFILEGIESVSKQTIVLLGDIKNQMQNYKNEIRSNLPKIYSQDLLNNLFRHPYTKIEFVSDELAVSRQTASKYLDELQKIGLISKVKLGKENYYVNNALYKLLINVNA
ncbi:Fic family protein [Dyadobacter subterraneus]|uniref:Fic family protein n=1 Tax=Dyadobacter subterraneus TaxID=2773304 RepID=A0ABR9WLA9_9BACT|nr:Fic family protein [Dyadobacter subterraneus]MBE9466295.1 Fic family protein [Dyadobacter subterraneus]